MSTRPKLSTAAGQRWDLVGRGRLGRHADVVDLRLDGREQGGEHLGLGVGLLGAPPDTVRPSLRTSEIWSTVATWMWSTRRLRSSGNAEITFAASLQRGRGRRRPRSRREAAQAAPPRSRGRRRRRHPSRAAAADLDHGDRDPLLDDIRTAVRPLPGHLHRPDRRPGRRSAARPRPRRRGRAAPPCPCPTASGRRQVSTVWAPLTSMSSTASHVENHTA